ncbi:MAG: cupin domain-containing protein [Schleiferiaceae bacterium]|jgi:mannose-6-phosphate isomerase-like protein (cupin superfamily)|nr:cupin domain-containing protein [Schleiferiaceae bacterium]
MYFKTDLKKEFYTEEKCHITEMLNTPEIENVSVSRARVEPGVTTQNHALHFDEIYYILEGRGEMQIDNGELKKIGPGELAFIKRGSSQRITNTEETDLIFLCICTPRFKPEGYQEV